MRPVRQTKSEKAVRDAIRARLRREGCYVVGIPGNRYLRGMPDLYVARDGASWWIEVKRPGGKLRQTQLERFRALSDHGIDVWVADSVERALEALSGSLKANWESWN